jgi:hypothetical protein
VQAENIRTYYNKHLNCFYQNAPHNMVHTAQKMYQSEVYHTTIRQDYQLFYQLPRYLEHYFMFSALLYVSM